MLQTSETYKRLLQDREHRKEPRLSIAGAALAPGQLRALKTYSSAFSGDSPSVGGALSREIRATIRPDGTDIPRAAELRPAVRLVCGAESSEWLPKGIYYIERRTPSGELLELQGYDAMRKAGIPYPGSSLSWPAPDIDVLREIAGQMGVEIDTRTLAIVTRGYRVPFPAGAKSIDVLGWIAASYAGNFVISDEGRLLLVPIWGLPEVSGQLVTEGREAITLAGTAIRVPQGSGSAWEPTQCGPVTGGYSVPPAFPPYSGVHIQLSEDNNGEFAAGTDTGSVLELSCPYGSQAMANDILELIRGLRYQPIEAATADIDPAAELGDGVVIKGVYAGLYRQDLRFTGGWRCDFAAPGALEISSEYPYEPQQLRTFRTALRSQRAELTLAEDRFSSQISNLTDLGEQHSTQLDQTAQAIRLEAEARASADEAMSGELEVQAGQIEARVKAEDFNGTRSFGWRVNTENGWTILSNGAAVFSVDPEGNGYFAGEVRALAGMIGDCEIRDGHLIVQSANIGSLRAEQISTGTLSVDRIGAGSLDSEKFSSEVNLTLGNADSLYSSFESESGNALSYGRFHHLYVLSSGGRLLRCRPVPAAQVEANPARYYVLAYDAAAGD